MIARIQNHCFAVLLLVFGLIFSSACAPRSTATAIPVLSAPEVSATPGILVPSISPTLTQSPTRTRAAPGTQTAIVTPKSATIAAPTPAGAPTAAVTAAAPVNHGSDRLDMEAIFPPGAGRDLVLENCLACHSFVRYVRGQRTKEAWAMVRRKMRPNVPQLDDAAADTLFTYLETNFNESKPVPDLPQWLLETDNW